MGLGQGGIGLRALGGDWAGELRFDRFLKNPRLTPAEMVATARAHLLERVQGRDVLAIQDSTSLPDETPKAHCNKRRPDDKESRRWVDATGQAADLLTAGANGAMAIADREPGRYEMFACRPEGVDVLVRANHNRALTDGGWPDESCDDVPELGRATVELPPVPGRAARVARIALRARGIDIKRPKRNRAHWAAALPPSVNSPILACSTFMSTADAASTASPPNNPAAPSSIRSLHAAIWLG